MTTYEPNAVTFFHNNNHKRTKLKAEIYRNTLEIDICNASHSDYDGFNGQNINGDIKMVSSLVVIPHVLAKYFYKKKPLNYMVPSSIFHTRKIG